MDEDVPKNHEQQHHCLKKFRKIFPCKIFPKKETHLESNLPKKKKAIARWQIFGITFYTFIPSAPLNLVGMTHDVIHILP